MGCSLDGVPVRKSALADHLAAPKYGRIAPRHVSSPCRISWPTFGGKQIRDYFCSLKKRRIRLEVLIAVKYRYCR